MTLPIVGFIGIGVLFVLLFSGLNIGIAMGIAGLAGFAVLKGIEPALGLLNSVPYSTFASYDLSIIPLFILMGTLAFYAGLSHDLYHAVHSWLGRMRGGLAMASVVACAAFAAVSGSSVATAATMGQVALPEMKKYKYDDALATGCIAAGGTMGVLIPPSVGLVIYGIITEQSIGKLFLAGFIPGVLEAVFYMITIYILCKRNPLIGPPGPSLNIRQKLSSLKNSWVVVLLFIVVIGGIYTGIFTPTEAAGVGAFGVFVFGLSRRRLGWQSLKSSVTETGKSTGMIFLILLGAMIFGYFLAVSRLPSNLADIMWGLTVNRYIILALILFIYLALGCVMDSLAIMLIVTPIIFPIVTQLGFNPIWFGILVVRAGEIGLITPPVGVNVFVIKGVAKDVPMYTIFRGIVPFLIADFCEVALLIAFPQISLFLPGTMS